MQTTWRIGNVFKLESSIWIISDVRKDYVSTVSFLHANCSGVFRLQSFMDTYTVCNTDENGDEYTIEASIERAGMDQAVFLGKSVSAYIMDCLTKNFDFQAIGRVR